MPFKFIQYEHELPPEGPVSAESRERADLDLKSEAKSEASLEHAKDIALFANSLGGHVIVGASDKDSKFVYHGLRNQQFNEVRDTYERAGKSCSPPIGVDCVPINLKSGKTIVVVNVPPYAEQIVGSPAFVRRRREDGSQEYIKAEHGWRYPMRIGSQTHDLKAEELPMYMNPQVRRSYLRLMGIPNRGIRRVELHYSRFLADVMGHFGGGAGYYHATQDEVWLRDVSLELNRVVIGFEIAGGETVIRVPLLDVVDVWEANIERWAVRVKGELLPNQNPATGYIYRHIP